MTPDVNILIAAALADHPHHAPALQWLEKTVTGATRVAPVTLLPVVAVGFVRIVTSHRFSSTPLSTSDALTAIAALLSAPNVRMEVHGDEWPLVAELCETDGLVAGDVTDAWIAASVLRHNEHLVTFDRGFRRLLTPRHLTVLQR